MRVEPKQTMFVVIEYDKENERLFLINKELIKVPSALDFPEKLKYIRTCVLDILREYDIEHAGIRIAESNSQNLNITRLHIEGVIQESFASSTVKKYFAGVKSSIAARLGMKTSDLANIIDGKQSYNIEGWDELSNKTSKEAALVAIGAMK